MAQFVCASFEAMPVIWCQLRSAGLYVVALSRSRIGVAQNRRCDADMFRIVQRDEGDRAVAKQMRVDGLAEGVFGGDADP